MREGMLIFQHTVGFPACLKANPHRSSSRRERQVMNIIYARGQATATEIHEALSDPPTFSATRAVIRTLQEKGHIRSPENRAALHLLTRCPGREGAAFGRSALGVYVFPGSPTRLMATLLESSTAKISDDELEQLETIIRRAKQEKAK